MYFEKDLLFLMCILTTWTKATELKNNCQFHSRTNSFRKSLRNVGNNDKVSIASSVDLNRSKIALFAPVGIRQCCQLKYCFSLKLLYGVILSMELNLKIVLLL